MSIRSDFSERPLMIGPIRGVRSWTLRDTALTGISFDKFVWTTENNRAICRNASLGGKVNRYIPDGHMTHGANLRGINWVGPHSPGTKRCKCGFYGYFNGDNDYYTHQKITGVVEAWGTMTIGSRGFRAEYASIVALVDNRLYDGQVWEDLVSWYPVPVFGTMFEALEAFPLTPPTE